MNVYYCRFWGKHMCECQICIKVNKLKVLLLSLRLYYIFPKIFKIPNKNSTFYHKAVAILRTSDVTIRFVLR